MKMNHNHVLLLTMIAASAFTVACSSTDKKVETPPVVEAPKVEAPVVAARSVDPSMKIDQANESLAKASMVGLPAFQSKTSGTKYAEYAKKSLETAKPILDEMPEGYVLQISGHANQHPDKSQRKGKGLSVQRAKYVYDYFVKNGVAKEKLSYRGAGSAEYDKNISRAENRRVTFKVVKAENAGEAAAEEKPAKKEKKKPAAKVEPKAEAKPEAVPAAPTVPTAPAAPVAAPAAGTEAKPDAAAAPAAPADAKPEAKPGEVKTWPH